MKLIVGLGNPGRKYEGTRHNIGFDVIREVARRQVADAPKTKYQGEVYDVSIRGSKSILLLPQTFMNLSGSSVLAARDFFRIEHQDILIVCDDFHLPLGRLRFRPKGSSGGQNGLANILQRLGSQEIPRLRVGIGAAPPEWEVSDFVLSKFDKRDREALATMLTRAASAVEDWAVEGTSEAMNRYNADPETVRKSSHRGLKSKPGSDSQPGSDSPNEVKSQRKSNKETNSGEHTQPKHP